MTNAPTDASEWAAEQTPPLLTSKQVADALGLKSIGGVRNIMTSMGVEAQRFHEPFSRSYFYDKAEAEAAAKEYLVRTKGKQPDDEATLKPRQQPQLRLEGIAIHGIPEHGWTSDQFMAAHSTDYVQVLSDRSASYARLSAREALALATLMDVSASSPGDLTRPPSTLAEFYLAAQSVTRNQVILGKLNHLIYTYFQLPNFCRLNAQITARVLYEMILTTPARQTKPARRTQTTR